MGTVPAKCGSGIHLYTKVVLNMSSLSFPATLAVEPVTSTHISWTTD